MQTLKAFKYWFYWYLGLFCFYKLFYGKISKNLLYYPSKAKNFPGAVCLLGI